jgi:AraC-like DNA-binding protein
VPTEPELVCLEDYLSAGDAPGRACAAAHVLAWWPTRDLRVLSLWGVGDSVDAELLLAVLQGEAAATGPYASLVELRDLEHIPVAAYARFEAFMSAHREAFAARVRHSALSHRGGLAAAQVAGYSRLLGAFTSSVHGSPEAALDALGYGAEAPDLLARLEALRRRVTDGQRGLERARRYLAAEPGRASLAGCARALGCSERSAQRAFLDAGTTFRAELHRARMAAAEERLRTSDDKVLAVGLELGFGRLQSFSDAFRRHAGVTPTEYRRRRRGAG